MSWSIREDRCTLIPPTCFLLEKRKSKIQKKKKKLTSHQSEWPSSINLQTINAKEVMEQREPSCTVGGNVN